MPSEVDIFAEDSLVYLGNQCSFHLISVNMVSGVFLFVVYLIRFQCIVFIITELIPFTAVLPSY